MRRAIRNYGARFGGNPVGTNPEITSQLAGNNPKHINFLNAEAGMRVNANGELIDPWGTPYFFHQLSGTDMEIHSGRAGPDYVDVRRFGAVGMNCHYLLMPRSLARMNWTRCLISGSAGSSLSIFASALVMVRPSRKKIL